MDFTSIFGGGALTLEQFTEKTKDMKLADLSTGEYVARGKDEDQKGEIAHLQEQLADREAALAKLEKASGDTAAIQAELEKYRKAEVERQQKEREAESDRILTAAAEQAAADVDFVNSITRDYYIAELKKAMIDPANKGAKAASLLHDLIKDADGIFRNPQEEAEKVKLRGVDHHSGKAMSVDEIYKIKDPVERQSAIANNINLFRKDD